MNLRDALIHQSPSLTLQRAAADEIFRLDKKVADLRLILERLREDVEDADYDLVWRRLNSALNNPEL